MTAIDRAALIEAAARALQPWRTHTWHDEADGSSGLGSHVAEPEELAADVLPVIARELLAPLRELHHDVVAYAEFAMTSGRRECACGKSDCPTVRLLDQIEADVEAES